MLNTIDGTAMTFLRNTWYCAGWSSELADERLVARTLLNEPVLMYRRQDGTPVAIGNRCPHRFAPLHLGHRQGDQIACRYHGLAFGPDGVCTHNPHGDHSIPTAARVPRYPLVERWQALWIWMGEPDQADPALIPDLELASPRPGWAHVTGYLEVPVHYEMVADNLLDLSHVPYLHPFLSSHDPVPEGFREVRELKQEGDAVWSMHCNLNTTITPLLKMLWEEAPALVEGYFDMRWEPPSNLLMLAGATPMGSARERGVAIPMAHLLTPAGDSTTHYFWSMARNRKVDDPATDEQVRIGITAAFKNEDEAMIAECYKMMGTSDLMSLKPVLLPGDGPAMRARRILARRIEAASKEAL